jgi:pyruvate/2-oxoglutarate dehydrogenase complex dihydrolipoamide dehydrogenase (E3) component
MRGVNIVRNQQVALHEIRESETGILVRGQDGQIVDADVALVATGRRPNSEGLGLKALGIDDSSALEVDAHMRLPNSGLYAVGDVTGMSFLDSTAFSQANVAINSISGQESRYDPQWTPRCIHTEPPVASVGWAENEAARSEIEFKVVSGSMRLVSDDDRSVSGSRRLLGCLVVGDHAAVIANIASIAIRLETPIDQLRDIPLAQPSAVDALMATLRKID